MRHLQSLTPLRGLAALTVLMFHLVRDSSDPSLPAFFLRGYLGVDLFFVLSGFVLAHVYVQGFLGDGSWRSMRAFLWARFARIYPVHLFITAILVGFGGASLFSPWQVTANLLLIQAPWPIPTINQPSWSLSAECYAYLLFPFLAVRLWRCSNRAAAAIAFALLVLLDLLVVCVFGELRVIGDGWGALARALPEFTVGMISYRAYSDSRFARAWRNDATFVAIAAALVAAIDLLPNDGAVVALFPLLLLSAVSNAGFAARLLNTRPLRWLGDISYSLYLGQTFAFTAVVAVAATPLGPVLGLNGLRAFTVGFALLMGTLIYRCVEAPGRSLLRDAPDRLRRLAARA